MAMAILAALIAASVSVTAYAKNAREVVIWDDGMEITVNTIRASAYDILANKGIILNNDDYLDLSRFSPEEDAYLTIYRAKDVFLTDDGQTRQVRGAGTVRRLLERCGVAVGERDRLSVSYDDLLYDGMQVTVSRAFDVVVRDYGADYSLTLTEGTVAQALELAGVTLEKDDFVLPEVGTPLAPGLTIHISRVTYKERQRTTALDYEVTNQKSASLTLGVVQIQQKGEKGEKESLYRDKYINGKLVGSTLLRETVRKPPVKEIRLVGTKAVRLKSGLEPISELKKPAAVKIGSDGVPEKYASVIVGTAKAYAGDTGTASGVRPKPGYIAVDPRQIPYGTQLWIVSNDGKYVYGYAAAADTGGFVAKKSCTVDLFMNSEAECSQWGHRGVTIYVLDLPKLDL
jgi:uncharacterized protein YabE (DUF348 family)/3D (Asp-Asp-Asp) domain-containing protein